MLKAKERQGKKGLAGTRIIKEKFIEDRDK